MRCKTKEARCTLKAAQGLRHSGITPASTTFVAEQAPEGRPQRALAPLLRHNVRSTSQPGFCTQGRLHVWLGISHHSRARGQGHAPKVALLVLHKPAGQALIMEIVTMICPIQNVLPVSSVQHLARNC